MFTLIPFDWNETPTRALSSRDRGVKRLEGLPIILLAEDDVLIQGIVEEALRDGGFEIAIASSPSRCSTLRTSATARS